MQLLDIFDLGKHGLAWLWAPYIIVSIILLYQHFKAVKSGWRQDKDGVHTEGSGKLKGYQYHKLVGWILITIAAIIIHFAIQASYR